MKKYFAHENLNKTVASVMKAFHRESLNERPSGDHRVYCKILLIFPLSKLQVFNVFKHF